MTHGSNGPDDLPAELAEELSEGQEAALFAAMRSLGDARPDEMDDATMLARVLGAMTDSPAKKGDREDRAPVISLPDAPPSNARPISPNVRPISDDAPKTMVRPRPRAAFRRTVAAAIAGFAVAATVAYAAQQYVRSVWNSPSVVEGPAPHPSPTSPRVGSPSWPAPSATVTESDTTTSATEEPATTSVPTSEPAPTASATTAAIAPPPSADDLLKRAQKLYTTGDMAGATAAYRALVARYPGSGEARAALISLGQLSLAGGRPAEALANFDRYLASGGPLSTEARVGRIAALRSLGRTADERAAIEQLLAQVGDSSVHAARLKARLAELTGR